MSEGHYFLGSSALLRKFLTVAGIEIFESKCYRVSLYLRRVESLQPTPYIYHNCKVLYGSAEYESDLVLVSLVRLQCIIESFQRTILSASVAHGESKMPAWMYIKAARAELQDFWMSLPPELRSNCQCPYNMLSNAY